MRFIHQKTTVELLKSIRKRVKSLEAQDALLIAQKNIERMDFAEIALK